MKLYSIGIIQKTGDQGKIRQAEHDLVDFSIFTRSSVKEFMNFTMTLVASRTVNGQTTQARESEYMCYCFVDVDGLAVCCICDTEYPETPAMMMVKNILKDYKQLITLSQSSYQFNLQELLQKYQDPKKVDKMCQIQEELQDTKKVMLKTVEQLLERGEKLDDIVAKSDMLSGQSKMFYTSAKKTNACC